MKKTSNKPSNLNPSQEHSRCSEDLPESSLNEIRKEIDVLDKTIWSLLAKRFALARTIAGIKQKLGVSTFDSERENSILAAAAKEAGSEPQISDAIVRLYKLLFTLSREYQDQSTGSNKS